MNSGFDFSSRKIGNTVKLFLSAAFASIATYFASMLLTSTPYHDRNITLVLPFLKGISPIFQLSYSLLLSLSINLITSIIVAQLTYHRIQKRSKVTYLLHVFTTLKQGLFWTFFNFIIWGTGSIFIYAIATQIAAVSLPVFFTSAVLGASIHLPICTLGYYYFGEFLLADATVYDLYLLKIRGLIRLYIPNFIVGISSGILFAYYTSLISNENPLNLLYLHRFKLTLLLFLWFVILFTMVFIVDQNSFTRRALEYKNIIKIWSIFVIIWIISLLIGTILFELTLRHYLVVL